MASSTANTHCQTEQQNDMQWGPHYTMLLITMVSSTKYRKTLSYIPTAQFYTSIYTTTLLFYITLVKNK